MSILRKHRSEATEALRQVSVFAGCDDRQLDAVARLTDRVRIPAGAMLMQEGSPGREAYVVVDGTATVSIAGARVATLGPGEVIGELALLEPGARTATVVADTDMDVLVVGPQAWATFAATPAVSRAMTRSLVDRLRKADAPR